MPTKKHTCQCPHCHQTFDFTPPTKQSRALTEPKPVFVACKSFWLEKVHPDWSFGAVQGVALNQILTKNLRLLKKAERATDTETQVEFFEHLIARLPLFFQDKDLPYLNSKHNEIFAQIKKEAVTPQRNDYSTKNSAARFNEAANRFKQ